MPPQTIFFHILAGRKMLSTQKLLGISEHVKMTAQDLDFKGQVTVFYPNEMRFVHCLTRDTS